MNLIRSIQINKPCHEKWEGMTDTAGGKYCSSCQKNVVDFSKLSNEQILAYLSQSDSVCGKFDKSQLYSLNLYLSHNKNQKSVFKNWGFAAMLIGMLPFAAAEAKPKPVYEQRQPEFKAAPIETDSLTYHIIRGIVKDDTSAIQGAVIKVEGTNLGTITNKDGYFELRVPDNAKKLIVQFIGYESKEVKIRKKKKSEYHIQLSVSLNVLGEIAITRDSSMPLQARLVKSFNVVKSIFG